MRGHVRKKGRNWYVVLEMDPDENGIRHQKTIAVRKELGLTKPATKRQAEELLVRKLKEIQDGTYFEPTELNLAEYLKRWLADYCKHNLRQKTYESYESLIRIHINPGLGTIPLAKLKPAHLQAFYGAKLTTGRADKKPGGLSTRTVRYLHSILKEALSHAVKWEYVPRNVAEAVTPPKNEPKKREAWTPAELGTFLEAVKDHRLYPLYLLAVSTGLRQGEILGLQWQHVDLQRKTLSVVQAMTRTSQGLMFGNPKTKSSQRTIHLPEHAVLALKQHRKQQLAELMALGNPDSSNDLVFTNQAGNPISPRNLLRHFTKTIEKAKLRPITFHGLRHTHATIMLLEGVSARVVSEILGHSSTSVTQDVYSHVLPDLQKEAARKMDKILSQTKGGKTEGTLLPSIK